MNHHKSRQKKKLNSNQPNIPTLGLANIIRTRPFRWDFPTHGGFGATSRYSQNGGSTLKGLKNGEIFVTPGSLWNPDEWNAFGVWGEGLIPLGTQGDIWWPWKITVRKITNLQRSVSWWPNEVEMSHARIAFSLKPYLNLSLPNGKTKNASKKRFLESQQTPSVYTFNEITCLYVHVYMYIY